MRLDPDYIRDILLSVEDTSDFLHATEYKYGSSNFPRLTSYSSEKIAYHVMQCEKFNLIYDVHFYDSGTAIDIRDLTPKGHEFLANIHESKIWNGVKAISTKIGAVSLDAIVQIASNVVTELIRSQFFTPTAP